MDVVRLKTQLICTEYLNLTNYTNSLNFATFHYDLLSHRFIQLHYLGQVLYPNQILSTRLLENDIETQASVYQDLKAHLDPDTS